MISRRSFLGCFSSALLSQGQCAARRKPDWKPSPADDAFLEDLSRRAFRYFWEQSNAATGNVLDRARSGGTGETRRVSSIAATGFGLTALAISAHRGWHDAAELRERARNTLNFFATRAENVHGWFYHFVDLETGERQWKCEVSSIDTALLLAGVLTAGRFYSDDPEIAALAAQIYKRVDFRWMLNGNRYLLSHGWKPETGFLLHRWDLYCELMILYLLAIGSPSFPIPAESWYAWKRPAHRYGKYRYVSGAPSLFTHQYSHAWVDFRGLHENGSAQIDWFANSVTATRAHRAFCLDLARRFPGYTSQIWGVTASDSKRGYVGWGGPPADPRIDGTVVPCAAGGSLMFAPDICVPALRAMKDQFGERIYGRYGFADAFHPSDGWTNPDVLGIDQGIILLSAENLRSGKVWHWFQQNEAVRQALSAVALRKPPLAA